MPVEDGDVVDDVERKLVALDLGAEVDVDELLLGRHEAVARRELQLRDQLMARSRRSNLHIYSRLIDEQDDEKGKLLLPDRVRVRRKEREIKDRSESN